MKKVQLLFLASLTCFSSCYDEEDFNPSNISNIISLRVENNNQPADGESKIKVLAEFPENFNTEDDDSVEFKITGTPPQSISEKIRFVEESNTNKKIAEVFISSNQAEPIEVNAVISINQSEVSKKVKILFKKALCESINISSSSLTISPDSSFSEIKLNTKLNRTQGLVSRETIAETFVIDTNSVSRGILVDYKNKTDNSGTIENRFTMGNDSYVGKLLVISESNSEENTMKRDTLIIYSQK